ncbi:MAG: terminase small subunit [Candidatus Peribacteraceae bacterium]|nr:terminase small subunit [Candidatus Peribacteraceae bacterium]
MTGKQETFVKEYVENNGNAAEAYKKAYPKCKTAHRQHGHRTVTLGYIQEAIVKLKTEVNKWKEGDRELCDKLFGERYGACVAKNDNTNAIRCIENKAKNVGYYALDNEQRTEKREMDERQLVEARKIALVLLTMPSEAIQVDSKVIEGAKDV